MPLSESSAYDPRSPNAPPPSMGPGARPISSQNTLNRPPNDPAAMLKEVTEIRSHYNLVVDRDSDPPILSIGYDIHNLSRKYTIPLTKMPLNSATSWLLYGGRGRAAVTGIFVIDTIRGAENMAQRPLSQSEAEGFALYASRRTLYSFSANASALVIGCGMAFLGRNTMKFPFRKPQPLQQYENFPNRWMPILRGQYARAMWHITRANLYVLVGLLLLNPLYKSMGDSAMMVGLYRDSRTREIMKSIKERGQSLTRLGSNREQSGQKGQASPQEQLGQDPNSEGYYNDMETDVSNVSSDGRDYSSNSGRDTMYTDRTAETSMLDDSAVRQRELNQSSPSSFAGNSAWEQRPPPPPQPNRNSTGGSFNDFLDDVTDNTSPPTGSGPITPIPTNSTSTGSAWDRVRRTSHPSSPNNTRGITPAGIRQRPGPAAHDLQQREEEHRIQTQGGSFNYDSGEAEKQLAKEMAQREFDEMMERERRGSRDRGVGETGRGFGGQGDGNWGGGEGESAWERRRRRG
jgi:hypothetical protein